ncbi:MAG TPA: circularly permuted type 2 ATP-grasp protein [Xanthobacteraceae bacterium]|jgi:uncharacterized circularly permuted ATP-grasp superfamily protein/uncharacterized alpha-E superfamily protein|nr:circularly permuted type 2 ATP-grasp protein [Xanthobacteraceae bacterium]
MAQFDPSVATPNRTVDALVAGYRPLPGVFDEMMDADGRVRTHWQPVLGMLGALGTDEINRRFAAADRYLRDSGVFYRVYEDNAGIERPWPLSHIPLIVEPGEWRQLERGLIQRAELLEAVLQDSYGPGTLTREGRLPATLIAGNPEFLRPLVGVAPTGGAHLRFYAVDVGRGADGRWWVLNDRAQAPSGAGYAIENRLALSRAIPDVYRTARVERVAPFFQAFQAELFALNRRDDARIGLLTPGPMNETYFEHAYLARYLGLLLVEGEDLVVQDDGVFIRTVSGLRRIEVLLRRIDADFADPLELNAASRLGAAGLLQAVRDGKVTIINSLGAGLVEARAMLAFLPALAPVVLGADLKISNVATWWLGHAGMREEMIGKLDSMVIASAFTEDLPDQRHGSEILGAKLNRAEREVLMQSIRDRGIDYVMQEAVTLSSMPVWRDGRLQPRPFTLRLYLAKVGDGWQVLPAGFVRIADDLDARAVSLQRGAATADAWVLSHGPVAETTLLPTPERMPVQRASGLLPSRSADNLFWVGRYVERAEATLRLIRAMINRIADNAAVPVIEGIASLLGAWSASLGDSSGTSPALIARTVLTRNDLDGALPRLAGSARFAAAGIRDRLSPDAWRAISDLAKLIATPLAIGPTESAITERIEAALRIISAFSGLAQENMTQLAGWRFLELGRRIERALLTCRLTRAFAEAGAPEGSLDVLLELADSQISYRQRYVMIAALAPVVDLVMLDPNNPRSLVFQLDRIENHLAALPKHNSSGRLSPVQQIAAGIATRLRTADASTIGDALIVDIEISLMKLSDAISTSFLINNERSDPVWDALA